MLVEEGKGKRGKPGGHNSGSGTLLTSCQGWRMTVHFSRGLSATDLDFSPSPAADWHVAGDIYLSRSPTGTAGGKFSSTLSMHTLHLVTTATVQQFRNLCRVSDYTSRGRESQA